MWQKSKYESIFLWYTLCASPSTVINSVNEFGNKILWKPFPLNLLSFKCKTKLLDGCRSIYQIEILVSAGTFDVNFLV